MIMKKRKKRSKGKSWRGQTKCTHCGGSGYHGDVVCPECGGTGFVEIDKGKKPMDYGGEMFKVENWMPDKK